MERICEMPRAFEELIQETFLPVNFEVKEEFPFLVIRDRLTGKETRMNSGEIYRCLSGFDRPFGGVIPLGVLVYA